MNDQPARADKCFCFFPPGNHRPIYMFHKGPAQKKWSDRKQSVHDRKWDFALPLCMLSAREKGVDCFLCLQWTYTLLICKRGKCHDIMENCTTNQASLWMSTPHATSGLELMSDPKWAVFQNTIGLFDCKIKVFEYETADLELSSFSFSVKLFRFSIILSAVTY